MTQLWGRLLNQSRYPYRSVSFCVTLDDLRTTPSTVALIRFLLTMPAVSPRVPSSFRPRVARGCYISKVKGKYVCSSPTRIDANLHDSAVGTDRKLLTQKKRNNSISISTRIKVDLEMRLQSTNLQIYYIKGTWLMVDTVKNDCYSHYVKYDLLLTHIQNIPKRNQTSARSEMLIPRCPLPTETMLLR